MARRYPAIDETLQAFIRARPVFFVATAPLDANGPGNVSPKAHDLFRIFGPKTVAYLDIFGGGVETLAHLRENGRMVLMLCSFQGPAEDPAPARSGTGRRAARSGVCRLASARSGLPRDACHHRRRINPH